MRITGIAIALIGLSVGLFCALSTGQDLSPSDNDAAVRVERSAALDVTVPLVVAGTAVVAGVGLAVLGGRGYRQQGRLPPPAVS